jgi:hypothetical protein
MEDGRNPMALTGGCRCGSCRYTLDYPTPPVSYACHCLNCQTMSGSGFVVQAFVPAPRYALTGDTIDWAHANAQGQVTTQRFCAICKTRLFSTNDGRPGMVLVRIGTLDDSDAVTPAVHMWTKRKLPWITLPPDAETFAEGVPPARMMALLAPNFT